MGHLAICLETHRRIVVVQKGWVDLELVRSSPVVVVRAVLGGAWLLLDLSDAWLDGVRLAVDALSGQVTPKRPLRIGASGDVYTGGCRLTPLHLLVGLEHVVVNLLRLVLPVAHHALLQSDGHLLLLAWQAREAHTCSAILLLLHHPLV